MAGSKVFETLFKIGAVFTGAAAFNQAQAAIKKTEHAGILAGISLKKMVAGVAAFGLGYKGLTGATDFLKESISTSREAKDVNDKLYTSLARLPQLQKMGTPVIKEQTERLGELAEKMEHVGGLDAETLKTAFAGLSRSFSPRQIYQMSGGFQDLLVKMKGVAPTGEDVANITKQIGLAIKYGSSPALKKMGILTEEQIKSLKKMHDPAQRAALLFKALGKETGETRRQMDETSKGIKQRNIIAWDNLKKAIGKPFIATQDAFTKSQTKILEALEPIASQLSDKMIPAFNKFSDTLSQNTPKIVGVFDKLAKGFEWILDHWQQVVQGITAIATAFLIFKTFQGVINTINGVAAAMRALQAVMSAGTLLAMLTSPTGLIIAGLIALAATIYLVITHWKEVKKWALDAWNTIQSVWGKFVPWFQSKVVAPFLQATKKIWQPLVEPVKKLWHEIEPLLRQLIDYIVKSFATLPGSLQWIWNNVVVSAYNRLRDLIRVVAPIAQQAFENWKSVVGWISANVIAPIVSGFADIVAKIKVGDLWGAFQAWANIYHTISVNIVNKIIELFEPIVDVIKAKVGDLWNAFASWVSVSGRVQLDVVDKIVQMFTGLPISITQALAGVGPAILGAFFPPLAQVQNMIDGIGRAWNAMISSLKPPAAPIYAPGAAQPSPLPGPSLPGPISGKQFGGLVAHPSIAALAERGIPEMVIPLQGTSRSRGLLSQTAEAIGIGGIRRDTKRAGGPVSVTLNAPITINGAQAGQEAALGREIQRAMQDPIRNLLEQLRRAKDEEARLAYA